MSEFEQKRAGGLPMRSLFQMALESQHQLYTALDFRDGRVLFLDADDPLPVDDVPVFAVNCLCPLDRTLSYCIRP